MVHRREPSSGCSSATQRNPTSSAGPYKDSGYTKGYLRISNDQTDTGNAYAIVACTVTPLAR